MKIEQSEPAFTDKSMSLRDYFAAQALSGLLADIKYNSSDSVAKLAYIYADAMLAGRLLK